MKHLFLNLLFITLFFTASINIFAQSEINPELLPENVSLQEASELIDLYEGLRTEPLEKFENPESDPEIQHILELTQNARQQIKEVLQNDERYLEFQERAENLVQQNLSIEEFNQQKEKLGEEYGGYFLMRIEEAGIDLQSIETQIRDILPENTKVNRFKGFSYGKKIQAQVAPPAPPQGVEEHTFTKFPFTDTQYTETGPVFRLYQTVSAKEKGTTSVEFHTGIGVGATYGKATIGQFVKVPAGIKRVEVEIDNSYSTYMSALALILGVAWSKSYQHLIVMGPSVNHIEKEHIGTALAPILWWSSFKKQKWNYKMTTSFVPAPSGGTYKIAFANEGYSKAFGTAGATKLYQNSTIKYIKVRFIR